MNTSRSILPTAIAALTVGLLLGGGVAVAATAPVPAPNAPPDCSAVALADKHGTADRLERAIDACLEATREAIATPDRRTDVLSCPLREIANRPWTADTIDRRLAACPSTHFARIGSRYGFDDPAWIHRR
jgi:hypothetical protein